MKTLSALVIAVLLAPSVFLALPQKTYALTVEIVGDVSEPAITTSINSIITSEKSTFIAIKETLNLISTYTNTAANVAQEINMYVLQPLAFILSGNLLKMITAYVISFVVGETNGTGAPQFVQNLQGHMQMVGDNQASAFFVQFGRNSNSPFASAIASSLRTHYLQNTSSAGFFAANRNTFVNSSPNPNAFLAGDWSQGGTRAWFALTTQTQNNPYTFYAFSQTHLYSLVGGATAARLAELNWGQGFLSWCGGTVESDSVTGEVGTAPGDACKKKDGTYGTVKTPGSTIKAALDKALGSTQDKLAGMGQLASEVGNILGDIGTVMSTVQFATHLLGGSDSGGLAGVGQSYGGNSSRLLEYQSPGYLGVTTSDVYRNAAERSSTGSDILARVAQYESDWNVIYSAATAANRGLTILANACDAVGVASQAAAARSAATSQVAPVLAQADAAFRVIAAARATVQALQDRLNSGTDTADNTPADLETLKNTPPTPLDVANAEQEAQTMGTATAIPEGSLIVSGGTIVDRMNLLTTNARALETSVCRQTN